MSNGRAIGNIFENECCKTLSAILDPDHAVRYMAAKGVTGLPVRRRSTSIMPVTGHWHGAGDFVVSWAFDRKAFPFTAEAKRYDSWSLDLLLKGFPLKLAGWWCQAVEQAERDCQHPLLLVGKPRFPAVAVMRDNMAGVHVAKDKLSLCIMTTIRRERVLICPLCELPNALQFAVESPRRRSKARN